MRVRGQIADHPVDVGSGFGWRGGQRLRIGRRNRRGDFIALRVEQAQFQIGEHAVYQHVPGQGGLDLQRAGINLKWHVGIVNAGGQLQIGVADQHAAGIDFGLGVGDVAALSGWNGAIVIGHAQAFVVGFGNDIAHDLSRIAFRGRCGAVHIQGGREAGAAAGRHADRLFAQAHAGCLAQVIAIRNDTQRITGCLARQIANLQIHRLAVHALLADHRHIAEGMAAQNVGRAVTVAGDAHQGADIRSALNVNQPAALIENGLIPVGLGLAGSRAQVGGRIDHRGADHAWRPIRMGLAQQCRGAGHMRRGHAGALDCGIVSAGCQRGDGAGRWNSSQDRDTGGGDIGFDLTKALDWPT